MDPTESDIEGCFSICNPTSPTWKLPLTSNDTPALVLMDRLRANNFTFIRSRVVHMPGVKFADERNATGKRWYFLAVFPHPIFASFLGATSPTRHERCVITRDYKYESYQTVTNRS